MADTPYIPPYSDIAPVVKKAYDTISPYSPPAHKLAGYAAEAAMDYYLPPVYSKIAGHLASYVPWTSTTGKKYTRTLVYDQVSKWLKSRRIPRRVASHVRRATASYWRRGTGSRRRRHKKPFVSRPYIRRRRRYGLSFSRSRSSSAFF